MPVAVRPGLELQLLNDEAAGSTLTELAGASTDLALVVNPGIDPDEPLARGTPVVLPFLRLQGVRAGGTPPSSNQALGLTASATGCDVSLTVTGLTEPADRPDGWSVELHRHLPEGAGTVVASVATEGGTEVSVTDKPGAGTHLYSAVEHAGVSAVTPLIAVAVDGCPPGDTVSISKGILHLGEPVDGVFLYLSLGGGSYRVPSNPAELITGDGYTFDLRPFLPRLLETEIVVEIWGRRGAEVVLLGSRVLGTEALLSPGTTLDGLWDLPFVGDPIPVKKLAAFADETVEFEWSSTVAHSGVRWFLTRSKPGPATVLNPTGVIQTGLATLDAAKHRFAVDLRDNTVPSVVPLRFDQVRADQAFVDLPVARGGPSGSTTVHADAPGTTWVWAVPVDGAGAPVGPASNLVELVIKPAPYDPTAAPPYDVVDIEVTIPPAPNPELRGCVRIVSETPRFPTYLSHLGVHLDGSPVPHGGSEINGALPYSLDKNGYALYPFTACPGESKNFSWGGGAGGSLLTELGESIVEGLQDGVGLVIDAANWVAETYNDLKAFVVSTIADVLCPSEVKATCETLVAVAVDALLATMGIPPSLPNFDDLANAAKGELVDLALDQLGVSEACDAVSGSVTGKTCGEVAVALAEQDACALAPEGQEQNCRDQLKVATDLCTALTDHAGCELATKNARDLVEAGMGEAYDLAVELSQQQVTGAMFEALTGLPYGMYAPAHGCAWGGFLSMSVVCPPTLYYSRAGCVVSGFDGFLCPPDASYGPRPPSCTESTGASPVGGGGVTSGWLKCDEKSFGTLPAGCNFTYYYDPKGPVCSKPPPTRVAIPEPRGHHQPIRVDVKIQRNGNPLPTDFQCGPISAVTTSVTPHGAVGKPYLAASTATDITYDTAYEAGWVQKQAFTLWLHEPNPFVEVPPEDLPPGFSEAKDLVENIFGFDASGTTAGWEHLLVPESLVGVKVFGDCIGEKIAGEDSFGVVGVIPHPLPRIAAGEA